MKKRHSTFEKNTKIQELLERHGKFNTEYGKIVGKWEMPDKDYKYKQNAFHFAITLFWRTVMQLFGPVYIKMLYGARVVGRKNLKSIKGKGAICICNHISCVDTLFVRQAVGHYRSYHTIAPINNKKGIGGAIIRHGGVLPFSSNLNALCNMSTEMQRLLLKGKIIIFDPEHALWSGYQKPRPMKRGAFSYASKFGVPVLPIFCTFKKNKHGNIKNLRINILPPIFPDENLTKKQNADLMLNKATDAWTCCYETEYGTKLEYNCNRRYHCHH